LTTINCTTAAGLRRYVVNTYFLSSDNGSGIAVPTLKRLEFNGATFTETPLVEGIERIQFEYGVDTDGNGAPDVYKASPATPAEWNNVVTVKVYALRGPSSPLPATTDTKTYTLGNDSAGTPVTVGPFNRQLSTARFQRRRAIDQPLGTERIAMTSFHRQRGATLFIGLVMLVVLTLFALSAFQTSSTNLKTVGNMQEREEAQNCSAAGHRHGHQ
jgi:hypothetical protein